MKLILHVILIKDAMAKVLFFLNMKKLILLSISVFLLSSCQNHDNTKMLTIIHAGSLSKPVREIVEAYKKEHPKVNIRTESWGSKAGARQITELNKPCDIFISADYAVIENFLIPEHTHWYIPFAGNEMVIAYTEKSRHADIIHEHNWDSILSLNSVYTGRSDPNSDTCGVRAVTMLMLSDIYYKKAGLTQVLLQKDFNFVRPKETDLIALLEKNAVDYLYIYKSIAIQHGFNYLSLPNEINLSKPHLADFYKQVSLETKGKTPHSKYIEIGMPILYGITVLEKSKNKNEALNFLTFFLEKNKGAKILEHNGQNVLLPATIPQKMSVPKSLERFVKTA